MNLANKPYLKLLIKLLTLTIFIQTFYAYFSPTKPDFTRPNGIKEVYDPLLSYILEMDGLQNEVESRLAGNLSDTSKFVNTIDDVLRQRFYHAFSEYTINDNWIAFLCSKIYYGIKYIVVPNDILKYPMAGCSQQGLVFQEMLRRNNITYATISFGNIKGHYTVGAYYENAWHYFDSNQEPIKLQGNPSIEYLVEKGYLIDIYKGNDIFTPEYLAHRIKTNQVKTININQRAGIRMLLFHYVTRFLSSWLWFIILSTYCAVVYINKKNKEHTQIKANSINKQVKELV